MSDTPVDTDEVEHIAQLARIDLDEDERELFAEQFGDILSSFEALDDVPEVEREPELTNVMRPDEIAESFDREDALANAPETEDDQFKGPNVS
ncbi:Asp-tRNA(Asn)/Glu-tRNA(Gln) amidotransferase subunit GatC [Halovenus rubra]|uniref:Asp-tRNA(Asn)/Glu-tRNA(Gln) amidotransferase subunit GatC n=2 Tax=Halovenus rubra TaxID=869890 RepID=A0ACC7E604_9EURY|nr:Asp-tRNA(Asn)/Glu-tRNA(Gln) amidotransferase subunit GatC [Halovenus rubra]